MPLKDYVVQPGDTLQSIARLFGVPTARIRSLNPEFAYTGSLIAGQSLQVPEDMQIHRQIEVNGYTFPFFNPVEWSTVFQYLTYLSIFGYEIRPGGKLTVPDSGQMVTAARQSNVAPLMVVTNTINGVYSGELLHGILGDLAAQHALIESCAMVAQAYGYYGVNFGFEQIFPEDYQTYASFLDLAANHLHALGLIIVASIRLVVVLNNQTPSLAESLSLYSRILDRFIITPGDFTCGDGPAIDLVQKGLDFVFQYVSNAKLLIGVPNCCYIWPDPYTQAGNYQEISPDEVDEMVRMSWAAPQVDPNTRMTVFYIPSDGGTPKVISCDSMHGLQVIELVKIYNLAGISLRTLNLFTFVTYQTIDLYVDIQKVLP